MVHGHYIPGFEKLVSYSNHKQGTGLNMYPPTQASTNSAAPQPESPLPTVQEGELHDLICVGFGPASLAIGVALHDAFEYSSIPMEDRPKVAFIERQLTFGWHVGMQVDGARMQISFLKDLATFRNPRSRFTFLSYLFAKNRLARFVNLSTFLPSRLEYQDYMSWCAVAFKNLVHYGREVVDVAPATKNSRTQQVDSFTVTMKALDSGRISKFQTRHVVIAAGGRPRLPTAFLNMTRMPQTIIHSSSYMTDINRLLTSREKNYKIAVIGGGQSGAEIFCDLQTRFPNAHTSLVIRNAALRPSDDSPFVNEIFDPEQPATVFARKSSIREASIAADKTTNYGVVRLELLEHIYDTLYVQSLRSSNLRNRILRYRTVSSVAISATGAVRLNCRNSTADYENSDDPVNEVLEFDAVIVATGYIRDQHIKLLQPLKHFLPRADTADRGWAVSKNYRVQFDPEKVSGRAGVWLQGCNEKTHGLSDSLLSTLAPRGGNLVQSIFDEPADINENPPKEVIPITAEKADIGIIT